jgi:uncharacterized phage infection (PIP) family protein YhgE
MFFKRVVAVLALVLGIAGMAGCLAGAYGVWLVQSRLERANDKVFDAVDRSVKIVQDQIPLVQHKVKDAKITTGDVSEAFREWGAKKAKDRIVSRLQIESRAEKLSGQLKTVDHKLESSKDAVRGVRQMLEISQDLGARVDPTSMDTVQERLESLQESLQKAERAVDTVRKFAEDDPVEDRLTQVAKLLARVLLTLNDVDQRLDDFAAKLSEIRMQAQQAHATTSHYIMLGAVACYALLAWIGGGQAALIWWGWSCFRPGRLPVGTTAKDAS